MVTGLKEYHVVWQIRLKAARPACSFQVGLLQSKEDTVRLTESYATALSHLLENVMKETISLYHMA